MITVATLAVTALPLEYATVLALVLHQRLHLVPGMTLSLLDTGLEHHNLILLQGILVQLVAERGFDTEPNFKIAASLLAT